MKLVIYFCVLFLCFSSCGSDNSNSKVKIDTTRLNEQNYVDSLKNVVSLEDFEAAMKTLGSEEFVDKVTDFFKNKQASEINQEDNPEKQNPFNDLANIANRLRDTLEQGIEKVAKMSGQDIDFDKTDFGKHLPTEPRKKTRVKSNSNRKGKIDRADLNLGYDNLKKQFGLSEESLLVEYIRDNTNNIYNNKYSKQTQQFLLDVQQTDKTETTQLMADYMDISLEELEILKKMPNSRNIRTLKKALALPKNGIPKVLGNYLKNHKPSPKFKQLTNLKKYALRRSRNDFLSKAKIAKAKFKKLNPTWYSSKQAENTYMDSKTKMVYLPLGKLSFADKVIDHQLGNPHGKYAIGSIGEPDVAGTVVSYNVIDSTICNIGIKGVLTLQFIDNVLVDVNGPDLYVFEIGQTEPTTLEISKDGENWIDIGKIDGGTAQVDIHDFIEPNESFSYVRLTDLDTYSAVPGADVDAIATIGGALRLSLDSEVLFETGKYELKKEGIEAIKALAPQIISFTKGEINIEGHTDDVGSDKTNAILSKKRATSVANELKKVVTSNKFKWKITGRGERQPIVPNDSDEHRNQNRRVEILILPTS